MTKVGYADIASHYRQQIEDGTLRPGDPMPSQRMVTEKFGVSGTTANRAFRMLKTEGLTEPLPGVGTVVAKRSHVHATATARLDRLRRTGRKYAPGEASANHQAGLRSVDDVEIAELLGLELRDEVVLRTRVFLSDGKPTSYARSVIHMRALLSVPEVMVNEPLPKFWHDMHTDRTGKTFTKSPEQCCARLATPFELTMLGVEAPKEAAVPVLVLRNVFYDEEGPIEVWEDVYAPGYWRSDRA